MKKTLLVLGMSMIVSANIFAQGQVTMGNTASSLVRLDSLAGPAVTATTTPSGGVTFELYAATTTAGVTNSSVAPLSTPLTALVNASVAGRIVSATTAVNALTAGQLYTFQIFAWQTSFGSYVNAQNTGGYFGASYRFNAAASADGAPPATSTLLAPLMQPFFLTAVPEPSTMVLAGLGAASLLLFRRRKQA
jgi:hypothetical protein